MDSKRVRGFVAAVAAVLIGTAGGPLVQEASAEPIDTWDLLVGVECEADPYNPVDPVTGLKDPALDPEPGTPEWDQREADRLECDNQRDHDRRYQPAVVTAHSVARYGEDWYRQPFLFDNVRFRYDYFPIGTGLGGVPAMEVYRPCDSEATCPNLPEELEPIEGPYPVVVIHHGFIATMSHHRYNAQTFAEAGYMAIVVNGTHPVHGLPNVQRDVNGGLVLEWLESEKSGEIGDEADLDRVAMAGHSQGSAAALSYQGDPRVHTILAWDGGDAIAEDNDSQPIMYQRTDVAFSAPQSSAYEDYPEGRERGLETYNEHKARGLDVMHLTFRFTNHIDWNGNGVGALAGNRYAESLINYYSLAWLDRHLQGRLAVDDLGDVVTSDGRSESEERAYRQAAAQDAFDRLTALTFPEGSIDQHNISMGWYDPLQHATSLDPAYGGNVPYSIEGKWVTDRLSPLYRSYCSVSVPDYVSGGSTPAAQADSGTEGMRFDGCLPDGG